MEAIFIIPTLVSNNIEDNIVALLCKLAERNIIFSNASTLKVAAMRKYSGTFKTYASENIDFSHLSADFSSFAFKSKHNLSESSTIGAAISTGAVAYDKIKTGRDKADEIRKTGGDYGVDDGGDPSVFSKPDQIEVPKGIAMYNNINLEPTFIQIKIDLPTSPFRSGRSSKVIRIGMKCVPFKINNVDDIIGLMEKYKSDIIPRQGAIRSAINRIKGRVLRAAARQYEPTFSGVEDIINAPSVSELSDAGTVSKMLGSKEPSYWSPLVILSSFDFTSKGSGPQDLIPKYRSMVRNGWGDTVIVNEQRGSISMCTRKMMSCTELPFHYLKTSMNIDPLMDYLDVVRGRGSAGYWNPKQTSIDNVIKKAF